MIINEGGKVFSDVVPFDQKQIKKIQYVNFWYQSCNFKLEFLYIIITNIG